jgi:hypothetical protein
MLVLGCTPKPRLRYMAARAGLAADECSFPCVPARRIAPVRGQRVKGETAGQDNGRDDEGRNDDRPFR